MTRRAHWLWGILLGLSSTSCADLGLGGAREFTIAVDSVTGPLVVASDAALTQYLFGPVGPNLCSGVKTVRVARTAAGFDLTAVGTRSSGGDCPAMPSYMEARAVTMAPPFPQSLLIRVRGAGGRWIERAIRVE